MMEKEVHEEFKRVYALISEILLDGAKPCEQCGNIINKGESVFIKRLSIMDKGVLIDKKDILTVCDKCSQFYGGKK